ncbi:MAG: hypothetical protein AABW50_01425 [Nanoarchaeota archaeon]
MVFVKGALAVFFAFGIFIFSIEGIFALGVSPAKIEMNFEPGLEKDISYQVFGGNPNAELQIYASGDLKNYITFDKTTLSGEGGSFTAHLKLPDSLEVPGRNFVYIGIGEKVDPELIQGQIGTVVAINVLINVYVPYPGRYLEVDLKSSDANVGEPVRFELNLESKGEEEINVSPAIQIYSGDKFVENLYFSSRLIQSQEKIGLKKELDTSGYNPGVYRAVAVVDYGVLARDEEQFRIGELKIDLINYTRQVGIGGIRKFELEIQSGWNDVIDGAYADIYFSNQSGIFGNFRTTTTTLTPWEKKKIDGYFDSSGLSVGIYDANITLYYFGRNVGSSSSQSVKVEFVEGKSNIGLIYYTVLGVVILIIILFVAWKFLRRKNGRKIRWKE